MEESFGTPQSDNACSDIQQDEPELDDLQLNSVQGRAFPSLNYPSMKRGCNCKRSRCIKLYCECFSSGNYCNGCYCVNCLNTKKHDDTRKSAIKNTLEKDPTAFQPKISNNQIEISAEDTTPLPRHNKGCSCKKSGCLKKYCECYQANVPCTDICKCSDCHNRDIFRGSQSDKIPGSIASSKLNYPQSSLRSNKFLYRIFLPNEDFSAKLEAEFKKVDLIQKDLITETLEKLTSKYLNSVEEILEDEAAQESIIQQFEQPTINRPRVQGNLKSFREKEPEIQKGSTNEDLACDEDFLDDLLRFDDTQTKETPKENQITEYKVKKYMIIKEFINMLALADSGLSNHRSTESEIQVKHEQD